MSERDDSDEIEERAYQEFADIMRALAVRRNYQETYAATAALGAKYIPVLLARGAFLSARRVRVWLADALLTAAMESEQPLDHCECLLARRLALVNDDLYGRSLKLGAFGGHCTRAGDPERALVYLEPLLEELEAEHARTGNTTIANCLESSRRVLDSAREALARAQGAS